MRTNPVTKEDSKKVDTGPARKSLVFADVILRSSSGKSVLESGPEIRSSNIKAYLPTEATLGQASKQMTGLGFEIDLVAPTHVTIQGSKALFERVFQIRLTKKSAPCSEASRQRGMQQSYYKSNAPASIPASLAKLVEAIEFPGPIIYCDSPVFPPYAGPHPLPPLAHRFPKYPGGFPPPEGSIPPSLSYDHLVVPDDVARDMDALKAHSRGIDGAGINLAMVDTGFMTPLHPYYADRGYDIRPVVADPSDPYPGVDYDGHGTATAACALAVAPGVTFTMFKHTLVSGASSTPWGTPAAAFSRAVAANPHIIACSFCSPVFDLALQQAIFHAVIFRGIVVLFACGNGANPSRQSDDHNPHTAAWPGSEPEVISVGGAHIGADDFIQASTYTSSGENSYNPGRHCPDCSGIAGLAYHGMVIALPTQPYSILDQPSGSDDSCYDPGASYDDGSDWGDGWAVTGGSSGATAMVAGVVALIMQAKPELIGHPRAIKEALLASCIVVAQGGSASGEEVASGGHPAGAGLVQAYRAVNATDIWMKKNPDSDIGLVPTVGRRPACPPFGFSGSPDVKVFSAALADPAADFDPTPDDSPVFGRASSVYVRVRNRGIQPTGPVKVRLYYADPGTHLIFPTDWNDGQSGNPAQGSIEVNGIATNLQTFPSVAAGGDAVLPQAFVWRPPDPTTATRTPTLPDGRVTGHFCLLVRLDSTDDPSLPGSPWVSIVDDNNIGMLNQLVYSAWPGHIIRFSFFAGGGTKQEGTTENQLLFSLGKLPRTSKVALQMDSTRTNGVRLANAKRVKDGIQLKVGENAAGFMNLTLESGVKLLVKVAIQMPADVVPGDYPVDVIQSSQGRLLGGLTLVARVQK